jgi:dipeptidyl aminopeptidase/acylaminoacyl peptidase
MISKRLPASAPFPQPLDRVALSLIAILFACIAALLLLGDRTAPHIRSFTWQDKQISAEDTAFILTFNRPMDHPSVENNLKIEPALPGKISWAGRRMAYTLETPPPYGTEFTLTLQGARDRFTDEEDGLTLQPFSANFSSRDRAFVYIGVEGIQQGRLVLQNLTQDQEIILTPDNLVVMDFKPYPDGDRIVFSASDRPTGNQVAIDPKLYTVTTGLHYDHPLDLLDPRSAAPRSAKEEAGVVTQILDNQDYQNLQFDLSPDGQTIVIQRISRANPADYGLWIVHDDKVEPLGGDPGGDFVITPDSQYLAVLQGEGTAIRALFPEENPEVTSADDSQQPLDFLPEFGRVLSFSKNGTDAAMVEFNPDYTESLFLVTSQGTQQELLQTTDGGSVLDAQFDPAGKMLYALVTTGLRVNAPTDEAAIVPGQLYVEQPYLIAVELERKQIVELVKFPIQQDLQMSLSADGLGILFDQIVPDDSNASSSPLRSQDGRAIATSRLWFFPIEKNSENLPVSSSPEALGLAGIHPRWLP